MKILLFILSILGLYTSILAEESLSNFNIECKSNVLLNNSALESGNYYMIAIFPDKCFPCNKNRFLLDKISKLKGLTSYGVFINSQHFYNFHNTKLVKFKTYFPVDIDSFIKGVGIKKDKAYTMLTYGDTLLYKKSGNIHFKDYVTIKSTLRRHYEQNHSNNN